MIDARNRICGGFRPSDLPRHEACVEGPFLALFRPIPNGEFGADSGSSGNGEVAPFVAVAIPLQRRPKPSTFR